MTIKAVCLHLFVQRCMREWLHVWLLASVCSLIHMYMCEHVRKGGWVAEGRRLSYCTETCSLCLPLSPRTGTATCPNCKEDEKIKELEFGCDCNEEKSALTASIFGAFWITLRTYRFNSPENRKL